MYRNLRRTMLMHLDPKMMRHNNVIIMIHVLFFIIPFSCVHPFSVEYGKVLELQESNFDSAISSFDHILVDFYAPWCGHCKRLSPELDAAAPILATLKDPIMIAKVNADKFNRLAKKYDVDGYPTIMLFNHGIPTEYRGPRKSDLLVSYLRKYAASDVTMLDSDSAVSNFVEEAGTFFPIYIGFGLNNSTIENIAIKYKKNAWFSVAEHFSEDAMVSSYGFDKVPALVSLNPSYNERSAFYGPFEEKLLEDFVKQNLLPLAVPVSHDTLKLMKSDGRKMVLTIVEDENEEISKELIKLLKAAASENRDLIFGYVSIKHMEEFAEKFDIETKLPKMIIWDKNDEYLSVVGSESIDGEDQKTLIAKFIEGYREGRTRMKRTSGPSLLRAMNKTFNLRMMCIFVFLMVVMILIQLFFTKGSDEYQRVPTQKHASHASSSVKEVESKEYKSAEKED